MTPGPVVLRAAAERDMYAVAEHYLDERGAHEAEGFVDAVERAIRHIAMHPASGSPRYGKELGLPGLRSWPVAGPYPYLVFYREIGARVDVWRILHGRRDIPASLRDVQPDL